MWDDIEGAILARLRDRLGPDVHVGPLAELEQVPAMRQRAPAVWVLYDGYTPGSDVGNGAIQRVTQDWLVVVATKSAAGAGKVDAARAAASTLAEQVLGALLGHPLPGGRFLRLSPAPGPEYDAGYCHVPLAFNCAATFRGTP